MVVGGEGVTRRNKMVGGSVGVGGYNDDSSSSLSKQQPEFWYFGMAKPERVKEEL